MFGLPFTAHKHSMQFQSKLNILETSILWKHYQSPIPKEDTRVPFKQVKTLKLLLQVTRNNLHKHTFKIIYQVVELTLVKRSVAIPSLPPSLLPPPHPPYIFRRNINKPQQAQTKSSAENKLLLKVRNCIAGCQ